MRHKKKKGRLNRRSSWRKATLKCMAKDLLKYQRIETTMAKAKALRSYAEPLITLAKNNPECINAKRQVFKKLSDRAIVTLLFNDIAPLYKDTPGGYTRIMALGYRKGDGARTVIMELTKRTIPDDKLLGIKEPAKDKLPKAVAGAKKAVASKTKAAEGKKDKKSPNAEETDSEKKEERSAGDVKRERTKQDRKKAEKKSLFKRFRRKSI